MSKGRVEAFSDGVFAVAITLLIFNVQIDKAGPGGLLHALLSAWPKYAAYVASFLTIGVMWINHHAIFERICVSSASPEDVGSGRGAAVRQRRSKPAGPRCRVESVSRFSDWMPRGHSSLV